MMAGLSPRVTGTLAIAMVAILVHGELQIKTKEQQAEVGTTAQQAKRRYKREWVKFATPCREREDNSKRNPIAKITSDFQESQKIIYQISGMGIDQPPFGIFVVDPNTGDINITSIVDREQTPSFLITCRALNVQGQDVEKPLLLTVKILDVNDNAPVFSQSIFEGEIEENSPSNTLVMVLNVTDADEPNHLNSKIAFKIIAQEPTGTPMFLISRNGGEILTLTNALDREQISSYHLIVSGTDQDGAGLSTQCECNVKVKDVNDNFPQLKHSQYSAYVEENTLNSDVLRFQVTDWDEEYSENWVAVYFFTSGNEGNWFEIQTDPRTNEGILKVVKALDYEQAQSMNFSFAVKNKAEFHQSVIPQYQIRPTTVTIQVVDVKEGISLHPTPKTFTVPKGTDIKKLTDYVLGTYEVTDEDTGKPAPSVRYAMGRNDGGLLSIDSKTGQIKFVKNIDQDSAFIVNKTITTEIIAVDENTGRTSTGTVYVEIPDFKENCPPVVLQKKEICSSSPSVVVSVETLERDRPAGSYTFSLKEEPVKLPVTWHITTLSATSARLRAQQQLSSRMYRVPLIVTGNQDRQCESSESLVLMVCQCDNRGICRSKKNPQILRQKPLSRVGPIAVGLLLFGLLLLLLAPLLLLTCDCQRSSKRGLSGGFIPVPDGSEGTLHQWGIEGAQPEDKELINICVPPLTTANGLDVMEPCACAKIYAREAVVNGVSGMELATKVGTATRPGVMSAYGAATGPGTVSGHRAATGPRAVSGHGAATGPGTVSGHGAATGPRAVSRHGAATGPRAVSAHGAATGPGTVSGHGAATGPTAVSGHGAATGPRAVSGRGAATEPEEGPGCAAGSGAEDASRYEASTGPEDASGYEAGSGPEEASGYEAGSGPEASTRPEAVSGRGAATGPEEMLGRESSTRTGAAPGCGAAAGPEDTSGHGASTGSAAALGREAATGSGAVSGCGAPTGPAAASEHGAATDPRAASGHGAATKSKDASGRKASTESGGRRALTKSKVALRRKAPKSGATAGRGANAESRAASGRGAETQPAAASGRGAETEPAAASGRGAETEPAAATGRGAATEPAAASGRGAETEPAAASGLGAATGSGAALACKAPSTLVAALGGETPARLGTASVCGAATGSGAASELGAACGRGSYSTRSLGRRKKRLSTEEITKDYDDGPVDMKFLDSYFSLKAFSYTEKNDVEEPNDSLLICKDQDDDPCSPAESLSRCSIADDDVDESFWDPLDPKFKKLAEIILGVDDDACCQPPPVGRPAYQCSR